MHCKLRRFVLLKWAIKRVPPKMDGFASPAMPPNMSCARSRIMPVRRLRSRGRACDRDVHADPHPALERRRSAGSARADVLARINDHKITDLAVLPPWAGLRKATVAIWRHDDNIGGQIMLDDVKPTVLRRIEVPFDFRLDWLHLTVQPAMGSTNSHPYEVRAADVASVFPIPAGAMPTRAGRASTT